MTLCQLTDKSADIMNNFSLKRCTKLNTKVLYTFFLCQLTCQSADIMSSLCGVCVRVCVRVRVNDFFSKTTSARDVQFFLNESLSSWHEKLFKAFRSVRPSVCYNRKCENFDPILLLSQCRVSTTKVCSVWMIVDYCTFI